MCSMRVIVHGQIDKIHSTDMSLNDVVPTNYMLVNSIKWTNTLLMTFLFTAEEFKTFRKYYILWLSRQNTDVLLKL